ncbi:cytochrome c peroxidase [Phaeodactylibacter xiamenensis]|uniref:cytochrome c peroxidase n=1 Tax=Phaeodactylibacter xiamenensis TaxID=1524460 RepID=UPI003BAACACE
MTMPRMVTLTAAFALLLALTAFGPDFDPVGNDCLTLPEEAPFNYANLPLPLFFNAPPIQGADNTPADNPVTDEGATLGRVLFYDTRLSVNQTVACASCHKQELAFSDDATLSEGFDGEHTARHSMGLSMAKYYPNGHFFWDERSGTLEEQALLPIQDPVEMGLTLDELIYRLETTEFYPSLFESAYGDAAITEDRIARALAQFIRSMVSYQSKWDQGRQQAPPGPPNQGPLPNFTDQENLGKAVFFDPELGNCAVCHGTDAFIASEARNNGLDTDPSIDPGLGGVTGIPQEIGLFKVPSLRNIGLTAPYMHDGRFETLDEVVDHYNSNVQPHPNLSHQLRIGPSGPPRHLDLTEEEQEALVAFLHTLTDEAFIADERWSDPFCGTPSSTLEPLPQQGWTVFPNPAGYTFTVRLDNWSGQSAQLRLMNSNGQQLRSWTVFQPVLQLHRQQLAPGLYYLVLQGQNGASTQPIVFE